MRFTSMQAIQRESELMSSKRKTDDQDILHDNDHKDGIDRRGFLKCMAWAGTGIVWTIAAGGIPESRLFAGPRHGKETGKSSGGFDFVQISDSHMGFNKPANTDVAATLQAAVDRINSLDQRPEFIIHTGDLSHQSKAAEFDTMDQILKSAHPKQIFYVPGEH